MADWHASPDGAAEDRKRRAGSEAGAKATTDKVKRSMGQQTWKGAARDVGRSVLRHKVLSAVIAVFVAGSLVAIGMVGKSTDYKRAYTLQFVDKKHAMEAAK